MHSAAGSYARGPLMTIVLCSGGLDSVIPADRVSAERSGTYVLSFNYGQRHKKELEFAERCAERTGAKHWVVDITDVGRLLTGSALTDVTPVPEGHYAEATMRSTVVPNRN